jgi:hypothetical protein
VRSSGVRVSVVSISKRPIMAVGVVQSLIRFSTGGGMLTIVPVWAARPSTELGIAFDCCLILSYVEKKRRWLLTA